MSLFAGISAATLYVEAGDKLATFTPTSQHWKEEMLMWYFAQNNIRKGPVNLEEIQSLIDQGTITPSTLVWKQGMDNWLTLTETELRDLLPMDLAPPIPVDIPPPIPVGRYENTRTNQRLEPGRLLKDAFNYAESVYIPMLAFFVPILLINILIAFSMAEDSYGTYVLLLLISYTCIFPFVTGASIYYVQQNLTQQGVTIANSMQKATERFSQLILVSVLIYLTLILGFILLVIPGIYLSIRLSFIYYAVIIENRSPTDAFARSWSLTKGFWWQILWAAFIMGLVIGLPAGIVGAILGASNPIFSQIVSGFIWLLIAPIFSIYYVFLFMSLVNLANENP